MEDLEKWPNTIAPDEQDPTLVTGQQQQGDPQAGAQDTSGGVPEDGREMAGDQTRQSKDATSAQAHQGATMLEGGDMEDQVPPRGVLPSWQPPSLSNVL